MNKNDLIAELVDLTRQSLNTTEELLQLSTEALNKKSDSNTWSVLECIAHLNIYGRFYLPEIEKAISNAPLHTSDKFKSGFLGGYFVKLIKPKEQLNPMKTLEKFNPIGTKLNKDALVVFKVQQIKILELLSKVSQIDLMKAKTAVSISKVIKMRLGDTLQFVIYHNQRHLIQANKILELNSY